MKGVLMKKIFLFLFTPFFLNAENIEMDALTGYTNQMQRNFNGLLSDQFYITGSIETYKLSENVLSILVSTKDESIKLEDEYFNYYEIIDYCSSRHKSGELDILEFDNDKIVNGSVFIYPEKNINFEKPTILINRKILEYNAPSLVATSSLRAMKEAYDYFQRIDNVIYTDWDEVENLLYLFDSYYAQARFIEDFFINNEIMVTRYETFILQSYQNDLLASFFMYFYGIDRDFFINGAYFLAQYNERAITITEMLNAYNQMISGLNFNEINILDEEGLISLATQYTYASFYVFLLQHYSVIAAIGHQDNDKSVYISLLSRMDEIIKRNEENYPVYFEWVTRNQKSFFLLQ